MGSVADPIPGIFGNQQHLIEADFQPPVLLPPCGAFPALQVSAAPSASENSPGWQQVNHIVGRWALE